MWCSGVPPPCSSAKQIAVGTLHNNGHPLCRQICSCFLKAAVAEATFRRHGSLPVAFELQDSEDAQVRPCFECVVALLKHVQPWGMAMSQRGLRYWWNYSFALCFLRPFFVLCIRVLASQCLGKEVKTSELEWAAQTFSTSIYKALNVVHLSPTRVL